MPHPSLGPPYANNHYSHHRIYSEFQHSLSEIRKQGSRSLSLSRVPSEDYYYPYDSLRRYFEDAPRLKNILKALLPPAYFPFDERLLRRDYIKVFSILLGLKRGDAIVDFVGNDNFSDQHLPFNDPVAFAELTRDKGLFNEFSEYQWRFCTPKLEGFDKRWEPRRILPFEVLQELGRGVNRTYLVKVDRAYNELRNESESELKDRDGLADHFVIKAFDHQNYDEFKQELDTYLRLKRESDDRITSMLRFYGSYSQDNISNVILEYADKGNLEQFLRKVDPPTDLEDRKILWRNILKLLMVLMYLHNCGPGGICHHDVTPRNILVSSRGSRSLYDYSFMLADFGHSRQMQRVRWDAQGKAEPRTRTYGAPECFSPADFHGKLQVSPKVDVFSLGCVLSDIATWFASGHGDISGSQRLEDYRVLRVKSRSQDFVDPDCFHDGLDVLSCVFTHHASICSSLREDGDTITPAVLYLVDSYMLQPEGKRQTARELWVRFLEIKHLAGPSDAKSSLPLESSGTPLFNSPPTSASTRSGHYALTFDKATQIASSTTERSNQSRPYDQLGTGLPNSKFQDHGVSSSMSSVGLEMASQSRSAHISDTTETSNIAIPLTLSGFSPMATQYNSTAQIGPIVEEDDENRAPDATTLGITSNRQYTSQASLPTQIGALSFRNVADLEPSGQHWIPANTLSDQNMFITQTRTTVAQEERNLAQASSPISSPPHPPPPNWPIEALHKLRRERKKLPHEWWIADLDNRHYVFLADNSTSMIEHWPQASEVLHTLAYLVKEFDYNGLDLCFTHSEEKLRSAKSTYLYESMRNHTPPRSPDRYTDIETSLGRLLDDYGRRIEDHYKRNHFGPFHRDVKRVTIIVLTDGRWQPDSDKSIAESLRRLASTLEACKKNPKQIGVQFIQFGDHEDARARLAHLDSELGLGIYDFVDTVPADGDGIKMLLGPINKWMDHIGEQQPSSTASEPGSPETSPLGRSTAHSSIDMSVRGFPTQPVSQTSPSRHRSRPSDNPSLHSRTASSGDQSLPPP